MAEDSQASPGLAEAPKSVVIDPRAKFADVAKRAQAMIPADAKPVTEEKVPAAPVSKAPKAPEAKVQAKTATEQAPEAKKEPEKSAATKLADQIELTAAKRRMEAEHKTKMEAFKPIEVENAKAKRLMELAKTDPVAALKELQIETGPLYKQLTDKILNDPDGPPDSNTLKLAELQKQLEDEQEARKKLETQWTHEKIQRQTAATLSACRTFLDSSETHVLVRTLDNPEQVVWETIVKVHQSQKDEAGQPIALTFQQAADMLEAELQGLAQRFQGKLSAPPDPAAKETEPARSTPPQKKSSGTPAKTSPKTITNALTPSNGGSPSKELPLFKPNGKLDMEARMKEVAARAAQR